VVTAAANPPKAGMKTKFRDKLMTQPLAIAKKCRYAQFFAVKKELLAMPNPRNRDDQISTASIGDASA